MPPTYDLLGYKRIIVDYHFSDYVPGALANANAADYVRACAELGVDSVLVYAKDHWGNCYFATLDYPRHPNVPQDLFGEILEGLDEEGIRGYAYFSVGWDESLARRHPEWVMHDSNGVQIRRYQPLEDRITGRWRYLCINSPARDYLLDQIAYLTVAYDFPALFLDILFMNPGGQVCHCQACKALWKEKHDGPLPTTYTPEYLVFAMENLARFQEDVRELIASTGKSIQVTHNFGLPYEHDDYVAFEFNALGRNFLRGSAIAKIMRAHADGREVELIGHRFNQDWDFTTKPAALMRWEAATVLAHNCALMWVDQPHMDGSFDPQALAAMKASYEVVDELSPHVRGSRPWAEVALLYSDRSARLVPDQELDFMGAYKLLAELHWPFDVIAEEQLSPERLRAYKLLIIPHVLHLSGEATRAVQEYVEAGGNLVFSHRTATANLADASPPLPGFGLVDIEAVLDYPASFIRPMPGWTGAESYLRVEEALIFRSPGELEVCALHTPPNIEVTWDQWVSHNVAPGPVSDAPAVVRGKKGEGRFIYIASRLFADYVRQGLPRIADFLTQLLDTLYRPAIWVEAPKMVEVTYNRRGDDLVLVLVNGVTNRPVRGGVLLLGDAPGHDAIDEVVPVCDIRLHLRDASIRRAVDLRGMPLEIRREGDAPYPTIHLDRLEQYDVIVLSGLSDPPAGEGGANAGA